MYDDLAKRLLQAFTSSSAYLVTGAGFSHGAVNVDGEPIPSARRLTEMFFATYATGTPAEDALLGDVFDLARLRNADAVDAIITRKLRVPPDVPVPPAISVYVALPWARIYTFNLDDLVEIAADQAGRELASASALRSVPTNGISYVHVNGDLADASRATFAERQYAQRLANRDPWLMMMAAELLSGTVIYVGSTLKELHMWSAIEARRMESVSALDPRPFSYLVSPSIEATRREMLAYSHVEWLPLDTAQFAEAVLTPVVARRPVVAHPPSDANRGWWQPLDPEGDNSDADSRYLLGQHPTWSDVQQLAVPRQFESELVDRKLGRVVVITGTPGAGKTTTAMKLALSRRAVGRTVRFVDVEDVDSYKEILAHVRSTDEPYSLVIDNAELLGPWLPSIANEYLRRWIDGELALAAPKKRIAALRLGDFIEEPRSVEVPLLEPGDVSALVTVLGRFDLLGHLGGKTRAQQESELASRSGRELLVAMIRATKGEEHEARVAAEYDSLEPEDRSVYGVIALARDLRYRLKQSELLLAVGKEGLLPLEHLLAAGTVLRRSGALQPRHARIAEIVVATMKSKGELLQAWIRLTQGLAVGHDITNRHTRVTRAITRLISHDEVRRYLGVDGCRQFYAAVRDHLGSDYHYWLQRGSFELGTHNGEPGARKFLETSRAHAGGDPFVEVAWGDLLFAEALSASAHDRQKLGVAAFTHVSTLFPGFGIQNPYPFGVAAKGCLQLADSSGLSQSQRRGWLKRALDDVLDEGIRLHRQDAELRDLRGRVLRAATFSRSRQGGKKR